MRECRPKRREERERARACGRERERPGPLAPLFICFFLPLGLPCVNWASQECRLFYPTSSLRSSDLPLFYFWGFFPFFVFQPPPCWTPFSYSNYLTLPNASEDVEQRDPHSLLVGLQNHTVILKDSWEVSYKTEYSIHFLYSPGILVGIYQKELRIYVHTQTCTQMFKAAVFIVAKTWKQPKCPLWVNG